MTYKTLESGLDPTETWSVVVEDDGHVAYAYLETTEEIVGDVWLYNVVAAPRSTKWQEQHRRPFLNPMPYCSSKPFQRISHSSTLRVEWVAETATLFIDEVMWAKLRPGSKPGWSILAAKAGPLAMPLWQAG